MKRKALFYILLPLLLFALLRIGIIIKRKYIINDYFNQGRWASLSEEYDKITKRKMGSTLLFGDSMTENFKQFMPENDSIVNMGISGDFSEGLIDRISNVTHYNPDRVFIMIGINDIIEKISISTIEKNYEKIVYLINKKCPNTKIYIQSTLPTRGLKGMLSSSKDINERVQLLNNYLSKHFLQNNSVTYVDMYNDFADSENFLKQELTTDGVHLNEKGYSVWKKYIF